MKYEFKYRLTQKSSLATIAKAVRALGFDMGMEKTGFYFSFMRDVPGSLTGQLYESKFVLDENVPDWLNSKLEEKGLLKPLEAKP